jgi:hypothetical protein
MFPVGFNPDLVNTWSNAGLSRELEFAVVTLIENGALHKAAQDVAMTCSAPAKTVARSGLGLEKMTR